MKPLLEIAGAELKRELHARARHRTFDSDEEILAVGDPPDVLPIIVSGSARMVQFPEVGKEVIIGIFRAGDMFAVPPLVDGKSYPASAYAMERSDILLLPRQQFLDLLRESHEFTLAVLGWMADMLRQKTAAIQNLAAASPEQRVAGVLLRLTEAHEAPPPVKISLRREDIGRMAGLTTETTIRAVRRLAAKNLLRIEHGKIFIDDRETLRRPFAE